MPFELHIALRYLLARRKQAFISVISLISTLGVTVGVSALIIALALMTGLQGELRNRILGATAHVYVWKRTGFTDLRAEVAKLRAVPGVIGAAPTIQGKGLVQNEKGEQFISLKGIDPVLEPSVTDLGGAMIEGKIDAITAPDTPERPPGILIGADLAKELDLRLGDSVTVLTAEGTLSPMGWMPRARRLRVVGNLPARIVRIRCRVGLHLSPVGGPPDGQGAGSHRAESRRCLRGARHRGADRRRRSAETTGCRIGPT